MKTFLKGIFLFVVFWIAVNFIVVLKTPQHEIILKTGSLHDDISLLALFPYGNPIEISEVSKSKLKKLIENEYGEALYIENNIKRKVTYNGHEVSFLQFSPAQDKLGFFFYPNDNGVSDISLAIADIPKRTINEVYRKSIRTSNWEWDDDGHVIVYYGCGTQCLYAYRINLETGGIESGHHVY